MLRQLTLLLTISCAAFAQQPPEIPIWSGPIPDAVPAAGPERDTTTSKEQLIAGKPIIRLGNVSKPTIRVYAPKGQNTGASVIVFPGGGYQILALDLEGTEVCDWLTAKGVTCVLLKYRVPKSGPYPKSKLALEDAQRTVGLVRSRAQEWHLDPNRIGVLGFSAGGHLAAAVSTHYAERLYPPSDAADKVSCRPDFAVVIYPGYTSMPGIELPVTKDMPPTFLLQTEDDRVAKVESSLVYYTSLKNAGVPVEMHLYSEGVHGYGLRRTELPVTAWPDLVDRWLRTIKMVH